MADILRYAEITEEPSFAPATPLPAGNTKSIYIDPSTLGLDAPSEADAKVESSFGRAAVSKYAGFYNPSGAYSYQIDVRTIPAFLKFALGGYAFTAGTGGPPIAPNIHESWGSNLRTLPSHQARLGKDVFEHLFQGVIIDTLTLSVEDATTSAEMDSSAAIDLDGGGLQNGVAVFTRLPVERKIPFHQVAVTIEGVLQARKMKNLEVAIANNVDAEAGRYLGSRYPGRIPANEREVTLSMEMDASDKAQLERYWGSTTGPTISGSVEFPVELQFSGGPNADGVEQILVVQIPKAFYTTVENQPEGRDEMVNSVEASCLQGVITLDDGTTEVQTDIYTKVNNMLPIIEPGVAA